MSWALAKLKSLNGLQIMRRGIRPTSADWSDWVSDQVVNRDLLKNEESSEMSHFQQCFWLALSRVWITSCRCCSEVTTDTDPGSYLGPGVLNLAIYAVSAVISEKLLGA